MPHMTRDDKLHAALQRLYDASGRFQVSVDTIQRLAKHLTLDTFVDSDALAPPASRLSIAGQLLLLDVDFSADDAITDIALSSGSHSSQEQPTVEQLDLAACLSPPAGGMQDGSSVWTVSLAKSGPFSFFRNRHGVSAEAVLRQNLRGESLGAFADNLAYLATLDRLSPPDGDLIATMDSIALYLALLHHKESELDPRPDVVAGNAALVGAVQLNDEAQLRVGVFLRFWTKNRRLGPPQPCTARLSVQSSETPADYFGETQTRAWHVQDQSLVMALDAESLAAIKSMASAQNWTLVVTLDEEVQLPKTLVEYLGLRAKDHISPDETDVQNVTCEDGARRISFYLDESSPSVPVKQFAVASLHQLARVLPAVRNQHTLQALVHSVVGQWKRVGGEAAELSPSTSRKIRQSLKLADDVPDQELMGLNSIPNDIMSTQQNESGLEDFMKDEYDDDDASGAGELTVSLEEIEYHSPGCDYLLRIAGTLSDSQSIDTRVAIRNGEIVQTGDVDMDGAGRFVQALALSEDVLLSLRAV